MLVWSSFKVLYLCDNWSRTLSLVVICLSLLNRKSSEISIRSLAEKLVIYWLVNQESRLSGPTTDIWPKKVLKSRLKTTNKGVLWHRNCWQYIHFKISPLIRQCLNFRSMCFICLLALWNLPVTCCIFKWTCPLYIFGSIHYQFWGYQCENLTSMQSDLALYC